MHVPPPQGPAHVRIFFWKVIAAGVCVLVSGCGKSDPPAKPGVPAASVPTDPPTNPAAAPAPNPGVPPATSDELVSRFRSAHAAKDVEGMLSLVCWKGVEDVSAKEMVRKSFQSLVGSEIASLRYDSPLPQGTLMEYERDGIRYRPNVKPTGHLVIDLVKKPGAQGGMTGAKFLVGSENGVWFIATAAPIPK